MSQLRLACDSYSLASGMLAPGPGGSDASSSHAFYTIAWGRGVAIISLAVIGLK